MSNIFTQFSGGYKGGLPGTCPLQPKFFSISCRFWIFFAKSYVGAPSWRVGAPSYRELWIHHCNCSFVFNSQFTNCYCAFIFVLPRWLTPLVHFWNWQWHRWSPIMNTIRAGRYKGTGSLCAIRQHDLNLWNCTMLAMLAIKSNKEQNNFIKRRQKLEPLVIQWHRFFKCNKN